MDNSRQAQFDALTVAMSRVITPVVICMAFAIWLVNSLGDPIRCTPVVGVPKKENPLKHVIDRTENAGNLKGPQTFNIAQALIFVGIFCALIVVFTFLLVWLFKQGHTRFIGIWLFVAVAVIFAYVGGIYLYEFCRSRCINLDWITLSYAVWNFTITGLVSIFYTVPRVVNQAYLIIMSALMAYIFRTLPEWATWTILAVLVVWDLFAVLAPCGPLRMLVKAGQARNEPLPALVYDTNPNDIGRDPEAKPAIIFKRNKKSKANAPASSAPPVEEPTENGEDVNAVSAATAEAPRRRRRRNVQNERLEKLGSAAHLRRAAPRCVQGSGSRVRKRSGSGR